MLFHAAFLKDANMLKSVFAKEVQCAQIITKIYKLKIQEHDEILENKV